MSIPDLVVTGNLGPEHDIGVASPGEITLKLGAGLVKAADGTIGVVLASTTQTVYAECHAGGSTNGAAGGAWARRSTVSRLAAGRWQVAFDTPHPDGDAYHVSFSGEESNVTRDNPKFTIEQGSKTAAGFTVMITVDDNGAGADTYNDQPWSYGVACPVTVLTGVAPV